MRLRAPRRVLRSPRIATWPPCVCPLSTRSTDARAARRKTIGLCASRSFISSSREPASASEMSSSPTIVSSTPASQNAAPSFSKRIPSLIRTVIPSARKEVSQQRRVDPVIVISENGVNAIFRLQTTHHLGARRGVMSLLRDVIACQRDDVRLKPVCSLDRALNLFRCWKKVRDECLKAARHENRRRLSANGLTECAHARC